MEASLKKWRISRFVKVYSSVFTGESSSETVVPDVQPDISEILAESGNVLLRSKTTESGKISLGAEVAASVVYAPEGESGLRTLHLTIPFAAEAQCADVTDECRTVAQMRLIGIDARALNSRRVSVRVEIEISIESYKGEILELVQSAEESENYALHTRQASYQLGVISSVREKTFSVTDEFRPALGLRGVREVLSSTAYLRLDEIKPVGGFISLRGSVESMLLCAAGDELTPAELAYSTPVSLTMEMDELPEDADISYRAMLTAAYFEPITDADGNRAISMEVRLVVQAVCAASVGGEVMTDAYSNKMLCDVKTQSTDVYKTERHLILRENCRGIIKTSIPVRETVSVRAAICGITSGEGKTAVSLRATAVFMGDDERYHAASAHFTAEFETAQESDMAFCPERAFASEIFASPCSEGIELRIPTELEGTVVRSYSVESVSAIELTEPDGDSCAKPSVVFIPCEGEFDAWALAKKYASTTELIERANPDFEKGMLLIPREV